MISIVIPTFNSSKTIGQTLKSILEQSYTDYEVIIVDNNSTDCTVEIIRSFKIQKIKIHSIENKGIIAKSRNLGVKKAAGEFIAFLDSDDWWAPNKLEKSIEAIQGGSDIVYHDLLCISPSRIVASRALVVGSELRDLLVHGNALPTSSVVVKKEKLEQVDYMTEDTRLIAVEDYDLWIRLAQVGASFKRIDDVLGYYTIHEGNTSNSTRVLFSVKRLKRKYIKDFKKYSGEQLPSWMLYQVCRLHSRRRQYRLSYIYGCKVLISSACFTIKLKVLATFLLCFLNSIYNDSKS